MSYSKRKYPSHCEDLARQGFPTVEEFQRGILLGCIAHALWLAAHEGMFATDCHWDDDTYGNDNGQGERWAVTFRPEGAVAVFYSSESERVPCPEDDPPYDQARYFRGMPDTLLLAKVHALSWMYKFDWLEDVPNEVITAAMWTEGERFTANEPWEEILYHSLWPCKRQLYPFDIAVVEWQNNYDLNDEDAAVLVSLYRRRLAATAAVIPVAPQELQAFLRCRKSASPISQQNEPGFAAARDMLASVGINLKMDEA